MLGPLPPSRGRPIVLPPHQEVDHAMLPRTSIHSPAVFHRQGKVLSTVIAVVAVVGIGTAVILSLGGAEPAESSIDASQIHTVSRGDFQIVIPASGELTTERQVEIRNLLETRAVITEIVSEGTFVQEGEVVLRIADDELNDQIKDGEDKVQTAESSVIAAEQSLAIRKSTMASDLEKADLEIEIAQLAMQAWEEGGVVTARQKLDLEIQTATINRDRLVKRAEDGRKLVAKGFLALDEYERDRIAMIESEARVKEAELAKKVYEDYTIKMELATNKSAVEQSLAEKGRVRQRHEAEIVKIEADVESVRFKRDSARERLQDLKDQLQACKITAPSAGLVVYASSLSSGERRGRDNEPPPQVGTELRQNELVMILPDTSRMIASLKVGEALSGRIRAGQPAVIYSDSLPGTAIPASVIGVSVLAESGGWRDPNRRDYTVRVLLDADPSLGLKPSMGCRGEIVLGKVENAVSVPIQSVFRKGPIAFVYVPDEGGFAQRQVTIGRSSEMEVEVIKGLEPGDNVLLRRPTPGEISFEIESPATEASDGEKQPWSDRGGPTGAPSGKASGKPTEGSTEKTADAPAKPAQRPSGRPG
jgi:HlyD family secretion protein